VSAATIVTFVATGSGDTLSVTNPQPAPVSGRIRLIPDADSASAPAAPFSLAALETKSFPDVLAHFGTRSAPAILAIETSDVVKVSMAPLRVGFPERHVIVPIRFNLETASSESLTLAILNGLVRVNIYEQGSLAPLVSSTFASSGEEVTRLRLPASISTSDGYAELIPLSGQVVGTAVNPPMRRRAADPPSTALPPLSITGAPACEFAGGVRASVSPTSAATYHWTLVNATAQGSADGNALDLLLGSHGYASVALERTMGGSTSTTEAVIAIDGKPAYAGSSASSVTLGEDSMLTWELAGSAPSSQTLTGTDFGTVTLDPTAISYTYRPTTAGAKTYILSADNACGSGSASGDYTVSAACTTPRIDSFTNSGAVCAGNSVQLSWATSGSGTVMISNGIGAVPASGSKTVSPTVTTRYTLTKTSACGTDTATTTATITMPSVSSFTIDRNPVPYGCSSTLRFTVMNGTSWALTSPLHNSITPNSGTGSGSFTAVYGLDEAMGDDPVMLSIADACGNTATRSLTVSGTGKTPVISSFTVPASVANGASAPLTFTFTDATSYSLMSSLGNGISPKSGNSTTGGSATYTRDKAAGPDTITLAVTDGCNVTEQRRTIN